MATATHTAPAREIDKRRTNSFLIGTDATTALLRCIRRAVAAPIMVEQVRARRWTSPTFAGSRHELTLRMDATARPLDTETLKMRDGHMLADFAIVKREDAPNGVRLSVEALSVEG